MDKIQERIKKLENKVHNLEDGKKDYSMMVMIDVYKKEINFIKQLQQPTKTQIPFNKYALVKCVETYGSNYKKDKTYEVKNGRVKGEYSKSLGIYNSITELNKGMATQFELVTENKQPTKTLEELGWEEKPTGDISVCYAKNGSTVLIHPIGQIYTSGCILEEELQAIINELNKKIQ
jgi:hypothetical protein